MRQLTCEMCGSTDLMKQDGVFVCQSCGTKYSVEEARKMMVEGTVDVTGSTVKVDTSGELANLYQIARRAKDDNNGENAAKYYDMILVKDPTSWEASFYLVYFRAMECTIAQIPSAAISVANCIDTVLKLIKDHVEDKDSQIEAAKEVFFRCGLISDILYNGAKNHYDGLDVTVKNSYMQDMINSCWASTLIMYRLGDNIDSIFGDYEELHGAAISAWKNGINKHNKLMFFLNGKEENKNEILGYVSKIQKYESSYQAPEINTAGGCYVATAVYGSYDCPQVWTLRRFRDYTLAETWYGRAFIRTYYAISPTLVKWFGHTDWFKKMWRGKLDRMVEKLNANGVENTRYDDRIW